MNKLLKKSCLVNAVINLIELLGIGIVLFFAKWLYPDFEYYYFVFMGICILFLIIQGIFFITYNNKVRILKKRTDQKIADILGNDIQEAYYFGEIGILITDESNTIIWGSDFLEDRNISYIDQKITDAFPALRQYILYPEKEENITVKVSCQNYIYEVKIIRELNLYIFKDVTKYESLLEYSDSQYPVIGQLVIDNYSDVNSDDISDMIASIRKMIVSYFTEKQVLIRSLKEDTYLLVCSKKNYQEMYKDKFSIVDKVRNAYEDGYTLSLGIAYGFPDYSRLMELASSALDVALSRGGDQVVISPFSQNLEFIGGKTESRVSRNRVKLRTISQSLTALISKASNILIMGHTNADFDAIGACLGIHAMAKAMNVDARIIFEEQFIEKKAKRAVRNLFKDQQEFSNIFVTFKKASEFYTEDTLVIIVDCNNPKILLYPDIIEPRTRVAIIDHHRRSENFLPNVIFNSIDTSASSSCELITEYIAYNHQKIELDPRYATMMLCGILLDTNHYRLHISSATYEASSFLKNNGADNELADSYFKEEYEEFLMKTKIMGTAETPFYDVFVCTADESDIIDATMLSIVAREALGVRDISACFAIGRISENRVQISARSNGTINCQILMEKLKGGGHFSSAATQLENVSIAEAKKQLLHVLDSYLASARTDEDSQNKGK